jgi:hypothetical protein
MLLETVIVQRTAQVEKMPRGIETNDNKLQKRRNSDHGSAKTNRQRDNFSSCFVRTVSFVRVLICLFGS